jgi:2-methylaconitate cis-trans-isomerase PrpF
MMLDGNAEPVQVMRPRPGSTETVSYTTSAGATSAAYTNNIVVRLYATSNCHVEFGPTASSDVTTSSMPLPAGSVEYFYVNKGDLIAVVQDTASGTLFITEMA